MAKSTTANGLSEFELEKIRRFTEQELAKLAGSELPFCYQLGTDVLVGRCRIYKIDDHCWRVTENSQDIFDFFTRKDAIFYCIALHQKQYQLANEIKTKDDQLNKLEFEAVLYRQLYKKAQAKNDTWGAEYYSAKYVEIQHRIDRVKKELQKTLNLAKYIKV